MTREPFDPRGRHSGEMQHSIAEDHARHDAALIAGHAASDLPDPDHARAEALLSSCRACTDLHRDLVSIQAATRANPAPAGRERDFRLTVEQAASLRRGSWLRSILRPFATAGSSTRPIAAAFTSVGVAGLLIATFVPGLLGLSAATPADRESAFGAGGSTTAAAPSAAPAAIPDEQGPGGAPAIEVEPTGPDDPDKLTEFSLRPTASDTIAVAAGNPEVQQSDATDAAGGQPSSVRRLAETSSPINLVLIGSLGFLAVGLALFGLRFAARRVR